ncbi:S8 family serine peptidase [Salipiger mangrovisoli]|uniref:S8 family serine peptidase n=1 Tax=Salipiger mangrovisoli TaxID=2865933 RepID=A0ABR9X0H8_9RHOB|nr:S8 family serine peptidase [Salipiger mangrovisoli]MBE9637065.1 S8 family serine peptidase [Salipiger mangrovisoli]
MTTVAASGVSIEDLTSDPKVYLTWYLQGSSRTTLKIDVESVWEDYSGAGVKVGVIDSQIDFNHVDLSSAYDLSLDYSFVSGTDEVEINSKQMIDSHGTSVAGVIAAEGGNGKGSVGIAHGATLVGLAIDYSSETVVDMVLAALKAAKSLDVVNNSWSFGQNFGDNFAGSAYAEYGQALEDLAADGRDGLGTSVVFSAGNSGVGGSSNYHNFQNSPYVIAVGAVSPSGDAWESTSLGANVLLSAPGENVLTTAAANRYSQPTGTSFAAPAVSATIALMLEANPELGYRDIQQILALSARKDGLGAPAEGGIGWIETGTQNVNGGGAHYSDSFGYGFLNVHDAVRLAESWTKQQTAATLDEVTVAVDSNLSLIAGSVDHISLGIEVDTAIEVEHVQLSMNLRWTNTGDIDVYLTSPEGTTVQLVYSIEDRSYIGALRNFELSSVASMGELGSGTWTLDIYNRNPDATGSDGAPLSGKLNGVTLTILGDTDDLVDDLYYYSDEMGTLYAADGERHGLADLDGGEDTINASAVTSNSVIDLRGKLASMIAGVEIDIDTPDEIENIFAGDGDDTLAGNAGDNLLDGGRGDDVFYLTAGEDSLVGGAGSDTLIIDALFSAVSGYFTETAMLVLSIGADVMSWVSEIEVFSFIDQTYSFSDLLASYGDSMLIETPAPGGEVTEEELDETDGGSPATLPEPEAEIPAIEVPSEVFEETDTETVLDFDTRHSGTDGDDKLRGDNGTDSISGGAGDDMVVARGGADWLDGGAGDDILKGGAGDDTILGGAGDDKVIGDDGDDVLNGGAGRDVLRGGAGADTFIFNMQDRGDVDVIGDFNAAEGDQILVTGLEGQADVEINLLEKNGAVFVVVDTDDGPQRVFKVCFDDVATIDILQQSHDGFLLG